MRFFHGRRVGRTSSYRELRSVAAVDVGLQQIQYIDCVSSAILFDNIVWRRHKGIIDFRITTENIRINNQPYPAMRLHIPSNHNSTGTYTCRANDVEISLNITGGKKNY